MGCYRVPSSPTPSVETPIPEDPAKEEPDASWLIFVGNLHPEVTQTDLYNLFHGRKRIRNIIIRTTRGCAVAPIPGEEIGPSDRCYASVEVIGWKRTEQIMNNYNPKNPPTLHGLPVTIALSVADMPDVAEIMERTIGYVPDPGMKTKPTGKPPPRKLITVQKTEIIAEDEPEPLVGPSRSSAKPKPRYNPLRRDRA